MVGPPRLGLDADVVVVGAGIVGLATARALRRRAPELELLVLDKERAAGRHQTGHNSGVLHSGIYYAPGSAKAQLCTAGKAALEAACAAWGVPVVRRGKVVVATEVGELGRLDELRRRAIANGVACYPLDRRGLAAVEPHVAGVAALAVPGTAVVDFGAVVEAMVGELAGDDVMVRTGVTVQALHPGDGHVEVRAAAAGGDTSVRARAVVTCGGLQSDRLLRAAGVPPPATIVPFRGEYVALARERAHLVRGLIYPVPDPRLPFLGVHATRDVHDHVHLGPNAVLASAREGYRWRDVDLDDLVDLARSPQLRGLARRWWRTGAGELGRSLSRRWFLASARRLLPELEAADLRRDGAGVRAQAVRPDGSMLDDFAIIDSPVGVHVLNAPSPAATASLAIGEVIARRTLERVRA